MTTIQRRPMIWRSLVSETQFATELTQSGIFQLCQVPLPREVGLSNIDDFQYSLHVGLHSFTSGIERLCKLAISCYKYYTEDHFPDLRHYSHKVTSLMGGLAVLDFKQFKKKGSYLSLPSDPLDPDLGTILDNFAQGAGRYEYLDSLSKQQPSVDTYTTWCALCEKAKLDERIDYMITVRGAIADSIYAGIATSETCVESLINPYIDNHLSKSFFGPSTAVALSLFHKARWAAACLSAVTEQCFYHSPLSQDRWPIIPYLHEVVGPALLLPTNLFFECHIAQFGDMAVVEEAIADIQSLGINDEDNEEIEVDADEQ